MNVDESSTLEIDISIAHLALNIWSKVELGNYNWEALKNKKSIDFVSNAIGGALDPLIENSKKILIDPMQGMSVIDIPSIEGVDHLKNIWVGSLLALIVSRRICSIRDDPNTGLPFTIYNASSAGEKLLKQNGIKYYSPEQNLGFHTDGIVSRNALWSPNFVSIYNIYLGYKKPGNFYWVPFEMWSELEKWKKELAHKRFQIEITPITYRHSNTELKITSDGKFNAALIGKYESKHIPFFNGEVTACTNDKNFKISKIKDMLISISTNKTRISIPLKQRRLFILNNWLEAHARDIFEEPFAGVKYTRSFIRMMSEKMFAA